MNLKTWMKHHGYDLADINRRGEHDYTALMRAAKDGEADIVAELLKVEGIDLNLRNVDGNNALWNACFANSHAIAEMLIAAGIAIDCVNDNGVTALMYTASSGREALTQLLIEAGADTTIRNLDDFTALDLASTYRTVKMLRAATV